MTAKNTLRRRDANSSFKPGIILYVKPKKKQIYSATVLQVDIWLFNILGMFSVWA